MGWTGRRGAWRAAATAVAFAGVCAPASALAALDTPGFRAVGVGHAANAISAIAVAPDGRLFAAVRATEESDDEAETPGRAEIRVYGGYAQSDGALLDEGVVWATLENVRVASRDEGLLGIALAPDFATSKLVYVHVTTTDEETNQHVRVYRENGGGTGDYLGTVLESIEPPDASADRSGGPMAFGVDGCLYLGMGDNGYYNRWNAQVLRGTDELEGSENEDFCEDVCRGSATYPGRVDDNDDPNHAGKVLRFAVEGASKAQGASGAPFGNQPFAFAAGLRNPVGLAVHPLTGQLWVADAGDSEQSEIGVLDRASNGGWPCLEGSAIAPSGAASCLHDPAPVDPGVVYGAHPDWRRPLTTHETTEMAGVAAYTGLSYPAEFFGDVFYLLRNSATIHRVDLAPPCFLPHPGGVAATPFHDSDEDEDFVVYNYDVDGDGDYENLYAGALVALAQAPNPQGGTSLYVVGRQGNYDYEDDSVIFRIEYATTFTPYGGLQGRVPASCFTDGVYSAGVGAPAPYAYEDPFLRPTCLPPGGACPGAPDGTPCDDRDPCNGAEVCQRGICTHQAPAADGTACVSVEGCHGEGVCQAGICTAGPPLPDGSPCPGANPCDGRATCVGGTCQPGSGGPAALDVRSLRVTRGKDAASLALAASFTTALPLAPASTDAVALELRDSADTLLSILLAHPTSDGFWKQLKRGTVFRYADKSGSAGGVTAVKMKAAKSGRVHLGLRGKNMALAGLDEAAVRSRLTVGGQCFTADLSGKCALDAKKLRCR